MGNKSLTTCKVKACTILNKNREKIAHSTSINDELCAIFLFGRKLNPNVE